MEQRPQSKHLGRRSLGPLGITHQAWAHGYSRQVRTFGDHGAQSTPSSILLTVLGSGAVLDGASRLGLRITLPLLLVAFLLTALLFGQAETGRRSQPSGRTLRSEFSQKRSWVWTVAVFSSVLVVISEIVLFVRRGGHDGFPVWLSDLRAEDNSSWIALGTSAGLGDGITPLNFGSGTSLIQGAVNGLGVAFAWASGLPPSSVGVAVLGVGLSYLLLLVIVPLLVGHISQLVWTRTHSASATWGVGISLSIFLMRFMREVRGLGHLTAGFTVLALLGSSMMLVSAKAWGARSEIQTRSLWALSFSCLLWFPLRPLSIVFAVMAVSEEIRGMRTNARCNALSRFPAPMTRATVFFSAVVLRGLPDLRSYFSREETSSRALISADGATYETPDLLLLLVALMVAFVLLSARNGTPKERFVVGSLVLYTLSVRFLDSLFNADFQYGSTKMLWMMIPVLVVFCTSILVRDLPDRRLQRLRLGGTAMVCGLLMANSTAIFGVVRSFGPLVWSEVPEPLAESEGYIASDSTIRWNEPGGVDLQLSYDSLPILCATVNESSKKPLPMWGFEPYLCTRMMSESSLERRRPRTSTAAPLDHLWKSFSLMGITLGEAVMGSLESGNDLSRAALLLNNKGAIIRSERVIDLLAQIALSDPVNISTRREWNELTSGGLSHSVEEVNLKDHVLSLWVENDVVEVVLVGELEEMSASVERMPRSDVAETLGRDDLFAGVIVNDPSIGEGLRCVILLDRQSEATLAWKANQTCE